MLTYDDLVAELESAWVAAGLHEHALIESVIPDSHDRAFKVELFPDHGKPLTKDNMPPWVEINFTWSALHQLYAEGHEFPSEPLEISWTYTASAQSLNERSDHELVRLFQRVVLTAFQRFYPTEIETMEPAIVEVRRLYNCDEQGLIQTYVQLVSTNLTDLSDQLNERDVRALRNLLRIETQMAGTIIHGLMEVFTPNGRGGYRTVDAA